MTKREQYVVNDTPMSSVIKDFSAWIETTMRDWAVTATASTCDANFSAQVKRFLDQQVKPAFKPGEIKVGDIVKYRAHCVTDVGKVIAVPDFDPHDTDPILSLDSMRGQRLQIRTSCVFSIVGCACAGCGVKPQTQQQSSSDDGAYGPYTPVTSSPDEMAEAYVRRVMNFTGSSQTRHELVTFLASTAVSGEGYSFPYNPRRMSYDLYVKVCKYAPEWMAARRAAVAHRIDREPLWFTQVEVRAMLSLGVLGYKMCEVMCRDGKWRILNDAIRDAYVSKKLSSYDSAWMPTNDLRMWIEYQNAPQAAKLSTAKWPYKCGPSLNDLEATWRLRSKAARLHSGIMLPSEWSENEMIERFVSRVMKIRPDAKAARSTATDWLKTVLSGKGNTTCRNISFYNSSALMSVLRKSAKDFIRHYDGKCAEAEDDYAGRFFRLTTRFSITDLRAMLITGSVGVAGDSDTQFTSPELRVIQPKSNALKAYRPWNLYRPNIQIDITEQDFYSTLIKENA